MAPCTQIRRDRPATRWLEALPLGNGRIGAMVWGDPTAPRFSLNESTLWSGSPDTTRRWDTSAEVAQAAREQAWELFRAGRVREAQQELEQLGSSWSQAYQPVGELVVRLVDDGAGDGQGNGGGLVGPSDTGPSAAGPVTSESASATGPSATGSASAAGSSASTRPAPEGSARVLDLAHAEHRVLEGDAEGAEHVSLISLADEVLVHAMPCPAGAGVSLELTSPLVEERRIVEEDGLVVLLRAPSDGVPTRHADLAELAWAEEGASRAAVVVRARREGERLLVVCAIRTTWQGLGRRPDREVEEVLAEATREAERALARGEAELRRRHREAPLPGIDEVSLELRGSGTASPEAAQLLATTFAYGRHLLASSSRAGLPPATLQGIWNDQVLAPWNSNYTVNINLEMNHWAAGVAHVPAAAAALEGYTAMLREAGRDTARRLYGASGWTVHHNSDPWGYTEPVTGDPKWATWPMGGLWLERELDSLATFTGEDPVAIAQRRLPALREAAAFALDLLHEGPDGTLVTFPSSSPENEWITAEGEAVALTAGSGMDRWLLHDVLGALLAAAELLGRDDDEVVQRAAAALARIPGPRIGADGRLLEWHLDGVAEVEPTHRHVSHLGVEYPGAAPQPPEVSAAVVASMEARGDEATGWSLAWKTALWARLHRADKVQDLLELFLRPAELPDGSERSGLYPNLFSAHPPFQIDGNIGIVAAIAECLVQSHRGEIELLPAAAPLLATGSVRGLRARPGVAVDMTWQDGAVTALTLRAVGPGALGLHRVRHGERRATVELRDDAPVTVTLPDPA